MFTFYAEAKKRLFLRNEAFFSVPNETREKPEENPNAVGAFLRGFL